MRVAVFAFLILTSGVFAATNDLSSTLRNGLFEEEANHNLEAAERAYQAVSAQFDKDRKLAATAIFRLGEVYRKQGKTNEASAQYQRIVREFSDQKTLVTLSRQNLGRPGESTSPESFDSFNARSSASAEMLKRIKGLSSSDVRQVLPTLFPDELLTKLLSDYQSAQVDRAKVQRDLAPGHPEMEMRRELIKSLNDQIENRIDGIIKALEIRVAVESQGGRPEGRDGSESISELEGQLYLLNATVEQVNAGTNQQAIVELIGDQKMIELFAVVSKWRESLRNAKVAMTNFSAQTNEVSRKRAEELASQITMLEQNVMNGEASLQTGLNQWLANQELRRQVLESAIAQSKRSTSNKTPARETALTTDEEEKEIRRIQVMIQNSPDLINAPGEGGFTPLGRAAGAGWSRVAKFLLDSGAVIDRASNGSPPIHHAASAGHKAMVELLAERGADLAARDNSGNTALHIAADRGFLSVAEVLVQRKADVNARNSQNNDEQTPLHRAAASGHSAMVNFLISKGADVDSRAASGASPIISAVLSSRAEVLTNLLAAGASVDLQEKSGRTALSFAAERGSSTLVKALIAGKADVNGGSIDLPLAAAARGKRVEAAELLLTAGADPNRAGKTTKSVPARQSGESIYTGTFGPYVPLQIAVSANDAAMVKLLLRFKADPNTKNPWVSPVRLLVASVLNSTEMLEAFLAAGADANDGQSADWPMLADACSASLADAVGLLLSHGAKADIQIRGRTPLVMAAERNCLKCVEHLLKAKVDPNRPSAEGISALHWAAQAGSVEMAEALISSGADVNRKTAKEGTPLHWAASLASRGSEYVKMLELLLSKGADPNVRNNEGLTPLDIIKRQPGSGRRGGFTALPVIPSPGTAVPGGSARSPETTAADPAALLRKHGALDELPDLGSIHLTRGSLNSVWFFRQDGGSNNYVMLLDALISYYGRSTSTGGGGWLAPDVGMAFPDFTRIRIQRLSGKKLNERKEIVVNVLNQTNIFDCDKNVPLEFGDVIEIPEREYSLAESANPVGLTTEQRKSLEACTRRKVRVVVRSENIEVTLGGKDSYLAQAVKLQEVQRILRSTSDLAHIKIKRTDPRTGKKVEIVGNGQNPSSSEYLWLLDGDVIEVPDK